MTGTLHENQYTFLIIRRSFLLGMRNVSDRSRENRNTRFICSSLFPKSCLLWANVETCCRTGQAMRRYGALVLHAGFLRIQTHTQNIILHFHCNNGCRNAPECYVIRTLPVLFPFVSSATPCMHLPSPHTCHMPNPSHRPRFYQPNLKGTESKAPRYFVFSTVLLVAPA
jgi:hypothetical protein